MPRPILRLATRFTRRTRATAWAIAFACMVLVGAMSLAESGFLVATSWDLSLFGLHLTALPIVGPASTRSELFPDNWAYVRPDLLIAMNATQGGPVQAILADAPLDPAVIASLRLTRLETLGAIGFVRGSVAEVQSSLTLLALVIAVVIGLLVYAAMSLEVLVRTQGAVPS